MFYAQRALQKKDQIFLKLMQLFFMSQFLQLYVIFKEEEELEEEITAEDEGSEELEEAEPETAEKEEAEEVEAAAEQEEEEKELIPECGTDFAGMAEKVLGEELTNQKDMPF